MGNPWEKFQSLAKEQRGARTLKPAPFSRYPSALMRLDTRMLFLAAS